MRKLKLFEGYVDDYNKLKTNAIKSINDFFVKYKLESLIYFILYNENGKDLYEVETINDRELGAADLRVEYIDYTVTEKRGKYLPLEKLPDKLLFYLCDQILDLEKDPNGFLELVVIGLDITAIMTIMKKFKNVELLDWQLTEMVEIDDDNEKTSGYEFQKFLIERDELYYSSMVEAGFKIHDNIKKEYPDLVDSKEIGLL